ncbi:hypothetical protein [Amycolatopsis methanolica]|uniref:Stf protein-Amycolatopsis methanolica n=1 Tax=Amycolatopsis methanolica 239 TaxID=1068978 RepID=A0A076MS88_AMYME|nr:hypothetical protein [Amycolatopsis methanolica]AIJ20652.1 stf protein - Amycolatopsis methanolica [Amycolatopsis methanolica 239]
MATATDALTNPERQFLGCLMQLPARRARRLLAGMRAADFAGGMAAHVLQLAIEVVAADQTPAPVTLYTHALATGQAPGEKRREWLSGWLVDTFRDAPMPELADHLKAVLLEAAWRRALLGHARRIEQAVAGSPTAVLRELADDTAAIDELWNRYQAALTGRPSLEVAA